ncbi:MAG: hypothetical protein ABFS42_12240 [Candidatus Krumholzibacteriota bacterium]
MRRLSLFILLLATGMAPHAAAQDSHYWDNQYGTKGELLGGVVVGSRSDLSATFYNPGWIALHVDPSLLLTTMAAEAYSIKLKDGLDRSDDPSSSTVTTSPGFLAGRFTTGKHSDWQWAYSYLQKVKFEFDATGIRVDESTAPPPQGNFWFSGEAFRKATANEYWYGATFSRKIRPNVGLGFTPYVVQRSMSSRIQVAAQGLDGAENFAQAYGVDEYDFWHVRLLAKIGLAMEKGNMSYGVTLTTPSLGLFGSGNVYTTSSVSGLDQDQDGNIDDPYLSANLQEGLSATWKSPMSLAFGASWKAHATGWHLTVEWYNAVKTRPAMEADDFLSQSGSPGQKVANTYNLNFGAKSLINFGVAFDHAFSEKFSLYGAFRSDFSSLPDVDADDLQIANWDLWHLSSGASFTFLNIEFTAGLQYSFGSGDNERFLNFNQDENGDVLGDFGIHEITYRRLKALIGFNMPFGETSG